jgi:hypothetical protein
MFSGALVAGAAVTADGLEHRRVEFGGVAEAGAARSRAAPQCVCSDCLVEFGTQLGESSRCSGGGNAQRVGECGRIDAVTEMQVEHADVAGTDHCCGRVGQCDAVAGGCTVVVQSCEAVGARRMPPVRCEMVQRPLPRGQEQRVAAQLVGGEVIAVLPERLDDVVTDGGCGVGGPDDVLRRVVHPIDPMVEVSDERDGISVSDRAEVALGA